MAAKCMAISGYGHGPKPSAMFVTGLSSGLCSYFRACKVAMFLGVLLDFYSY